jgi:uncharacterized protein
MPAATPPPFADTPLAELIAWADSDRAPPVDQWHPAHRGSIDIRIAADGRWFHEGGEIKRAAMVRLFSRILRREGDGSHVLVTPAEQLTITVDDAPFVAAEVRVEGEREAQTLAFRLNTDDIVIAGAAHPLILRDGPAGCLPYLHVRGDSDRPLLARLARPVYYALADLADDSGRVMSDGVRFVIGEVG